MFDFGEAIRKLKSGHMLRRAGWNGKNMHIYLEQHLSVAIKAGVYKGAVREYEPVVVMFTAQGKHQPGWLASQADMLAEDWEVVQPGG